MSIRRLLVLLLLAAPASAQDVPGRGTLVGPGDRPLPLKHTAIRAEVTGGIARVIMRQTFENPFSEPIEAVYLFPLPDEAAVDGFTMQIGAHRIVGEIHTRKRAERIYSDARSKGKTAALLTQERPNIFTQRLANILPGEEIVAELSYAEELRFDSGAYKLVFPMTIGPRYLPRSMTPSASTVPGAWRHYLRPGERPPRAVSVEIALDAGLPVEEIRSTTHAIKVARRGGGRMAITLDGKTTIPNKDLVLTWRVAGSTPTVALHAHRTADDGYFALTIVPEQETVATPFVPREVVLVLDCSGSMSGIPLETAKDVAKETLRRLDARDTFQVLRFSERASGLAPAPLRATPEHVARGISYVNSLLGGGGTEMLRGIRAALSGTRDRSRLRVIHFLTDGYVGNETRVLDEVRARLHGARIHPLGIGSSPNRFLIERLARVGRGAASYITCGAGAERIAKQVKSFVERVRRPTLVDLEIDWGGLAPARLQPALLPDLFRGQPVVVKGIYRHAFTGEVKLRGWRGGVPFEQTVPVVLPERVESGPAIAKLWARTQVRELMLTQGSRRVPEIESEVTRLGMKFKLMTAYTAFVAVDEQVVVEGGVRRTVRQPLVRPEGMASDPAIDIVIQDCIGLGGGGSAFGGRRVVARQLRARGGGAKMVDEGLGWLSGHQSPDGRWDSDEFMSRGAAGRGALCDGKGAPGKDVGATGVALLSLLGAGHTHRAGSFRGSVRQGLRWLAKRQDADGCFGPRHEPHWMLDHAVATLAMAEAYGMTRSGLWRAPAQKGIEFIQHARNPPSGWGHGIRSGHDDLVVTAWMVMALKSAQLCGLKVDAGALQGAHAFVKRMTDPRTGRILAGASTRPASDPEASPSALTTSPEALVAMAMLIRIFCGEDPRGSQAIQEGAAILLKSLPAHTAGKAGLDLPFWYFGSLAMFQTGGPAWKAWNAKLRQVVKQAQRQDGNFQGSWDPAGAWGSEGGRIQATALMTMCMEVYYRYGRVFGSR